MQPVPPDTLPHGPTFAAVLDQRGYAHVIGRTLAEHPDYTRGYWIDPYDDGVTPVGHWMGDDYESCWRTLDDARDVARRWNATPAPRSFRAGLNPLPLDRYEAPV